MASDGRRNPLRGDYTPPQGAKRPIEGVFRTSPSLSNVGARVTAAPGGGAAAPTYGDAYEAAASVVGISAGGGYELGRQEPQLTPRSPHSELVPREQQQHSALALRLPPRRDVAYRDAEAEQIRQKNQRSRIFEIAPPMSEADDLGRLRVAAGTSPRGAGAGVKVYDTTGTTRAPSPTGDDDGEIPYMGALALMGGRTMQERRALELQQEALRADLEKQVVEKRLAKAIALAELKMDDLNLLRDCERKNVDEYGRAVEPGSPIAAARSRALKKAEREFEAWAGESDIHAQAREQAEEEALRKAEVTEERERRKREHQSARSSGRQYTGNAAGSGGGGGRLSPVSEFTPRDVRANAGHGPASVASEGTMGVGRFGRGGGSGGIGGAGGGGDGGGTTFQARFDDGAAQVSQAQLEELVTSLRDMQEDYRKVRSELDEMTAAALRGSGGGDARGNRGAFPRSARRAHRPQKPGNPPGKKEAGSARSSAKMRDRAHRRGAGRRLGRFRGTIAQEGRNRPAHSGRPVFVTRDEREKRAVALRRHVQASNARVCNFNDPRVKRDRGSEWVPGRHSEARVRKRRHKGGNDEHKVNVTDQRQVDDARSLPPVGAFRPDNALPRTPPSLKPMPPSSSGGSDGGTPPLSFRRPHRQIRVRNPFEE